MRTLAVEKGDTKTIARIDKLMEKEQGLFDRKSEKINEQEKKTLQTASGETKSKDKDDKDDDKD